MAIHKGNDGDVSRISPVAPIVPIRDWEDPDCKKCDNKRSDTPGIAVNWTSGGKGRWPVNGKEYEVPEGFEHLHCKCLSCGYDWLMQTSDADDRALAIKEAAEAAETEEDDDKVEKTEGAVRGHARRVIR